MGGAHRQHDRVVHFAQLVERERLADIDVAVEVDPVVGGGARKAPHHVLGLLVIGRDPEADQAVGRRQPVDDVDPALRVRLQERIGRIESRRPEPTIATLSVMSPLASPAYRPRGRRRGAHYASDAPQFEWFSAWLRARAA